MRALALALLLCLVSSSAWAIDRYVCPDSQGEYGLEDGSSLANCYDGNADISWASISPGETLYFCGDWGPADARITVADSGTAGNYITLSGNAAACGRTVNSVISRAGITGTNGRAIAASNTAATRQYIKIEDLTLKDCSDYCLQWDFSTTGAVTDNTALWVNRVKFENCGATAVPVCLRHTGENLLVENSTFYNAYNDQIWLQGGGVVIRNNTFELISNGGIGGDGIQIDATGVTDSGTVEIHGNYIDHSDFDVKYCILATGRGTSNIWIHDNYCECPPAATNADPLSSCHGIVVDARSTSVVKLERNYVRYGRMGININGNPPSVTFATPAQIDGNVITGSYSWGILTDGYVNNVDIVHNTVNAAGDTAIDIRKNSFDSADAIDFVVNNNVMTNSPLGLSYSNQTPSPRGFNGYYGNTLDVEANGVAGVTTTGDLVADPGYVGAEDPTSAGAFCLGSSSTLRGAGTNLGVYQLDHYGRGFTNPPPMGAMSSCEGRPPATSRPAAATRVAN